MKALLLSEFYKVFHNRLIWIVWLVGLILPLVFTLDRNNSTLHDKIYFMGDFLPILVCVLVGTIWCSEYSYRTIHDLFSTGYCRSKVFCCKLIITWLSVFILLLVYGNILLFFSGNTVPNIMLPLQALLIFGQSSILILMAVLFQSYSKTAMAGLIFLIFNRMTNSMYEANAYHGLTANTFLVLFYGVENGAKITFVFNNIMVFIIVALLCLGSAIIIFEKQEVK